MKPVQTTIQSQQTSVSGIVTYIRYIYPLLLVTVRALCAISFGRLILF